MAQVSEKIAKRYAKALFELCEITQLDAVKTQLLAFSAAWTDNKNLQEAISNPAFPIKERMAVITSVAEKVGVTDGKVKNLLSLLTENRRLPSLAAVAKIFSAMIDELKKALALTVTSAFPIPSDEVEAAKEKVQKAFGGLASIDWAVDASLIGGLRIQAGDKLLDTSIKNSLDRYRAELLG